MHEKSRLPVCGRTFQASVEGRKGVRLEQATVSDQETRTIPIEIELAGRERLIGDEAEKPDSQEVRVHRVERKRAA